VRHRIGRFYAYLFRTDNAIDTVNAAKYAHRSIIAAKSGCCCRGVPKELTRKYFHPRCLRCYPRFMTMETLQLCYHIVPSGIHVFTFQ